MALHIFRICAPCAITASVLQNLQQEARPADLHCKGFQRVGVRFSFVPATTSGLRISGRAQTRQSKRSPVAVL